MNDDQDSNAHPVVLDWKAGLNRLENDEPFYRSLLQDFLTDNGGDFALMKRALATNNLDGLKRLAHTLKGLTEMLGAFECHVHARELDRQLSLGTKPDIKVLTELLATLGTSLETLCDTIDGRISVEQWDQDACSLMTGDRDR